MSDPIIPRDFIKTQARRAADRAAQTGDLAENPYQPDSQYGKRWAAAFYARQAELGQHREASCGTV
jgi:hypothetical protein